MSLFNKSYVISVCIPVYGTEKLLMQCLNSVAAQKVPEGARNFIELVIVDDCSPGCEGGGNTEEQKNVSENGGEHENQNCDGNRGGEFSKQKSDGGEQLSVKRIVKQFSKKCPFPVNFIRHDHNKGLVEARRTAIYEAKGKYIFNLDSDDSLPQDALLKLYEKAEACGADIVQGKAAVCLSDASGTIIDSKKEILERYRADREKQINNIFDGELLNLPEENQILDGYLLKNNHMGFLWGKLFTREIYIRAFEHIPPIECTMCEDLIQYVWLCYEAKKYVSINDVVYNYSINTGISSRSVISDISRWEKVCSAAGVFTALYQEFENPTIHFTDAQKDAIRHSCIYHLKNNLDQLEQAVAPELKQTAYEMLCDYWGENFVQRIKAEKSKS